MPQFPASLVDVDGDPLPACFLPSTNHPGSALVPPYWAGTIPIYPWGEWMKKRGWFILRQGVDFKVDPSYMNTGLRKAAKSRNLKIHIKIKKTYLLIFLEEQPSA